MSQPLEINSTDPNKPAVVGRSDKHQGIFGETSSTTHSAIVGFLKNPVNTDKAPTGAAIHGIAENRNNKAGHFDGAVEIIGKIRGNLNVSGDILLINADCAEEFDILEETR